MIELKVVPSNRLLANDFEEFKKDLGLLLAALPAQKLADWMGMHKANLSKKINGTDPITHKFLVNFYRILDHPLKRLKEGASAHTVEEEMNAWMRGTFASRGDDEGDEVPKWQESIFNIETGVKETRAEIVSLRGESTEVKKEVLLLRGDFTDMKIIVYGEIDGIKTRLEVHDVQLQGHDAHLQSHDAEIKQLWEVVIRLERPRKTS